MPVLPLVRNLLSGGRQKLRSDRRLANLVHGSLSGLLGRGVSMLISAVTLPLTIRYLGKEEYGIWVTISTTVVMLAVLDLGISSTLTNFIARAHAAENKDEARHYFATAFWLTVLISTALAVIGFAVWSYVPWASLFGVRDPRIAHEASLSVAISFGFFLINLPLSLANRVLSGYQEVQTANYFSMISGVLSLFAILTAVHLRASLSGLMLYYCVSMLSGAVVLNIWLSFWGKPWLRPAWSSIRLSHSRSLFGEGFLFFILQIAGLVVFNSDNLVITHFLGAAEVTPYSVASRLMSYASMLQGLLVPAMWPALADAYHRGDLSWMRKTFNRIYRGTILAVGAMAILLSLGGQWLIRVWATRAAVPSKSLLVAMGVWAVILAVSVNQASLLAATQRLQLQAVTAILAAVFNLFGTIYLVQRMGALGVILATIVSYLLFIIAPQEWEVRNILRGRYKPEVQVA